jgi:hypothetical protein
VQVIIPCRTAQYSIGCVRAIELLLLVSHEQCFSLSTRTAEALCLHVVSMYAHAHTACMSYAITHDNYNSESLQE